MELNLAGRTALITGGSRGIGRAIAGELAAEGCNLVLVSRNAADLHAASETIAGRLKVRVITEALDLADSGNVTALVQNHPDIDILVNNAGAIPGGTLAEVDETRWRAAWDLKVMGTINMTRAYYPLMKARGGGTIINIIGNAALTRDPGYICGVTGNAGLTAFTESIGSISLRDNIRVNGVSPGLTATDRVVTLLSARAEKQWGDPGRWRELVSLVPGGRLGEPAEIAAMVALLASPRSNIASGAVITMDAGVSSRSG